MSGPGGGAGADVPPLQSAAVLVGTAAGHVVGTTARLLRWAGNTAHEQLVASGRLEAWATAAAATAKTAASAASVQAKSLGEKAAPAAHAAQVRAAELWRSGQRQAAQLWHTAAQWFHTAAAEGGSGKPKGGGL